MAELFNKFLVAKGVEGGQNENWSGPSKNYPAFIAYLLTSWLLLFTLVLSFLW
jgi:hypothetical protein